MTPSQRRKIDARFSIVLNEIVALREVFKLGEDQPVLNKLDDAAEMLRSARKEFKLEPEKEFYRE